LDFYKLNLNLRSEIESLILKGMNLKQHVLIIIFLIVSSCMNTTTAPSYEYADGSANLYIITTKQIKYIPVKPEESSSGVYSGGEPKTVALTSAQYKTLQTLFEKAIRNEDAHIKNRVMMSAIVSSISSDHKKQCILTPGSEDIAVIEQALKSIVGN